VLTASSTLPVMRGAVYVGTWLGVFGAYATGDTGDRLLSEDLAAARAEEQPVLSARLDDARAAMAGAGWQFGPADDPRLECWTEAEVEVCTLYADTQADALVPPGAQQQLSEIDRLLGATAVVLTDGGWRCDRPLSPVAAGRGVAATCHAAGTELRLDVEAPVLGTPGVTGDGPRVTVRLQVSREAYRSHEGTAT
jgi:hypothetical protein